MYFENRLEINQSQKLVMNMRIKQSLSILNMSRAEIEEEIKNEAESNPLLDAEKNEDGIDWEKYIKDMDRTPEIKDKNEIAYNADNEVDFENMVKYSGTMYDYLMEEIGCFDLSEKERKICSYIIDSLDEDGYLRENERELAKEAGCSFKEYIDCLRIVQQLEPAGIGARNLSECLLIQIESMGEDDEVLKNIIEYDLELIGKNKLRDISKKYKISLEKCKEYIDIIRRLDPRPGRVCSSESSVYVQPDVIIRIEDGEPVVVENDKDLYTLKINTFYSDIIKNGESDDKAKEFVKEKLNSAVNLMKNIESRKNTVMKIALEIAGKQREFMLGGSRYLKPMKMKDLADELGFHESTISRGVNGKYMLTPFGMYEFRYFFTNAIETAGNEEGTSSTGIKSRIRDIIASENRKKPMSDEAISKMLKVSGINIARRTVAKYREELGIPSSSRRKEF